MKQDLNTYGFLFPLYTVTFVLVAALLIIGTLFLSAISLTGMAIFDVKGPMIPATLSWVMSLRAALVPSVASFLSSAMTGEIWYLPVFE